MFNKIKKLVMAFTANQIVVNNKTQPTNTNVLTSENNLTSKNDLTLHELELLLGILKDITLKGYQIEIFYNLIVKLQNQYMKQNNS